MTNYWKKRYAEELLKIQKETAQAINNQLAIYYRQTYRQILAKLTALYNEIQAASADGTLLISDLYRYDKYYKTLTSINTELKALGKKEQKIFNKNLTKVYKEAAKLIGDTNGLSTRVNQKYLEKALKSVWAPDKKNWSDRIWNNKQKLQQILEKDLVDCVATGSKIDTFTNNLQRDFNTSFHRAEMLARTEISYIYNQSAIDKFKDAGVEKLQWLATEDERTCAECVKYDMKIIKTSEVEIGKNAPPIHPGDRCTLIAVIDKTYTRGK